MFAVIGQWQVDAFLDSAQLSHIAETVRQKPGFVRGSWGQESGEPALAYSFVVVDDEVSAVGMAEGVRAAIPTASVRVIRVLADASVPPA